MRSHSPSPALGNPLTIAGDFVGVSAVDPFVPFVAFVVFRAPFVPFVPYIAFTI